MGLSPLFVEFVSQMSSCNSHYGTDISVSSAFGAGNTNIGYLKARLWRAFK